MLKPDPVERPALLADPRFHIPPYFGPAGWVALDLTADVDEDELGELVETSYRQVALQRMIRALDERAGPAPPGATP